MLGSQSSQLKNKKIYKEDYILSLKGQTRQRVTDLKKEEVKKISEDQRENKSNQRENRVTARE